MILETNRQVDLPPSLTSLGDGPIRRITAPDTPVPYSPPLEEFFLPNVTDVVRVARELNAY